jgi:hypothetical protein
MRIGAGSTTVRMLLIIGNNNMSLRELYTMVFDNHPAGWGTSFMSAMPSGVESIISGYDAVTFEIGSADSPERMDAVKRLRRTGATVLTHLDGRQLAEREQELRATGAYVVANPVNAAHISEALDALSAKLKAQGTGRKRVGVRERFKRILSG